MSPSPIEGDSTKTFEHEFELLADGQLEQASTAPAIVQTIVKDADWLIHTPYAFGGGHSRNPCAWLVQQPAYDGSGLISYLLLKVKLISHPMLNEEFVSDGESGQGNWRPGRGKYWSVASCDGGTHLDLPGVQLGYWTYGAAKTRLSWHLADSTWIKAESYGHCKFSHLVRQ